MKKVGMCGGFSAGGAPDISRWQTRSAQPPDLGWFCFSSPGGASELTTLNSIPCHSRRRMYWSLWTFSDAPPGLRNYPTSVPVAARSRACHRLISDAPPARDHRNFTTPLSWACVGLASHCTAVRFFYILVRGPNSDECWEMPSPKSITWRYMASMYLPVMSPR